MQDLFFISCFWLWTCVGNCKYKQMCTSCLTFFLGCTGTYPSPRCVFVICVVVCIHLMILYHISLFQLIFLFFSYVELLHHWPKVSGGWALSTIFTPPYFICTYISQVRNLKCSGCRSFLFVFILFCCVLDRKFSYWFHINRVETCYSRLNSTSFCHILDSTVVYHC